MTTITIGHCRKCGPWTREWIDGAAPSTVHERARNGDRAAVTLDKGYGYVCPRCGKHGVANEVKATVSKHTCESDCQEAEGAKCRCSCGGKNHGLRWRV